MCAFYISAAILYAPIPVTGDMQNGAERIIPGVGRNRSVLGSGSARGYAHFLALAFIRSVGVDRSAKPIAPPSQDIGPLS